MRKLLEIKSDCLCIVERLKEIDPTYFVVLNLDSQKFELHSHAQKNTYCLTFPFDTLDERALTMTLQTRVQNSDQLFEQMEKENQRQREKNFKEILSGFKEKIYET